MHRRLDALASRRSTRKYSDRPIPLQLLSNLLWAAYGINRPSGERTAPYWRHCRLLMVIASRLYPRLTQ